jgi:hypothetical protein
MTYRAKFRPLPGLITGLAVAGVALATGCTGSIDNGGPSASGSGPGPGAGTGNSMGGGTGNGGSGTGGAGPGQGGGGPGATGGTGNGNGGSSNGGTATGGSGGQGTIPGGTGPVACDGPQVINNKRIVRLSMNQISNSIHAIFGDTLGSQVDSKALIGPNSPSSRTFPPLSSATEGATIIAKIWQDLDAIAAQTGEYALANVNAVTACGAAPTDACAQTWIGTFAQKVFRRPLTAAEKTSITQVYTEVKGFYTTIPEAIQYTVYALLQAPGFVYRTEIGASKDQAGPLTPYEFASALSFFLTDAPPDQALLDAAAAMKLGNTADITTQVTRILGTAGAKKNLESAMFSYFALDSMETVVIDDTGWTAGVRDSAYTESQRFFATNLWGGPLSQVLTSKKTQINKNLATIYGVTPFPPSGVTADASGFAAVTLPDVRSGILTQVGFLAARSRPDAGSVIGRGLAVNAALLCAINPPFPTDDTTKAAVAQAVTDLANKSEREKAAFRAMTSPCLGCHLNFDAYGLALENFDAIGRYRTMDPQGRAIDASVTLPASLGSAMATNAADMSTKIATSAAFNSCIAKNMINWALAEGSSLTPNSCAAQGVVAGFNAGDKSFSKLLTEIAVSQAFTNRNAGANQ